MAFNKIENRLYNDANWESEILSKNILKKGFYNLIFNMDDYLEPALESGSSVDISGVLYQTNASTSISGTAVDGINFIIVEDVDGSAVVSYTQTALPAYDYDKLGYYDSGKRYVLKFIKVGDAYYDKVSDTDFDTTLKDKQDDLILSQFTNTYLTKIEKTASDAATTNKFGNSSSIDGEYFVIASNLGTTSGTGKIYIYKKRLGTMDILSETIITFPTIIGKKCNVSISGDYIVRSLIESTDRGMMVYHRTGDNTWDAGTKVVSNTLPWDYSKYIAISGDYIIKEVTNIPTIFHRTDTNTWDSGFSLPSYLGTSCDVGIDGDYAISSDYTYNSYEGCVYIHHRTGTNTWDDGYLITSPDPSNDYGFGQHCSISGDYVASLSWKTATPPFYGRVWVFHRIEENAWDSGVELTLVGDRFSWADIIIKNNTVYTLQYLGTAIVVVAYYRTGENSWSDGVIIDNSYYTGSQGYNIFATDGKTLIVCNTSDTTDTGKAYLYKLPGEL